MNTQEHLEKIKAKCLRLLAIAEKRTPGEWKAGTKGLSINGISYRLKQVGDLDITFEESDLTFIAACAGTAEAGWRATIAAIEFLYEVPHVNCESQRFYFSDVRKEEQERIGCNCKRGKYVEQIIAAWPEELL